MSEKGKWMGREGIASFQSQTFAQEREAIVQFDWLVARQSKSDIRNTTRSKHIWSRPRNRSKFLFGKRVERLFAKQQ